MQERSINDAAVICYWQYEEPSGEWRLVESYLEDEYGNCITKPSVGSEERHGWYAWLHDEETTFPGRAVTMWSVGGGIRLFGFNPPTHVSWLGPMFAELLRDNQQWSQYLQKGYQLYLGTIEEAAKYWQLKEQVP